ncbi:SURF1 family protein [Phenylobacterium deserti]|uniref:SURF1-like protein n=1 Tax=Phenylobacterium deserti TaxID=1914756 RepID=A0A328AQA9_9CAUL|nr:SURF1 family protein [Phenylobacterium deserti]RAK56767.1 SURF1 family protein [Phenylobacterium deserti]
MTDGWEPQLPPAEHARAVPVRFPVGMTIATVIALGILIFLGSWQLQRMKWKQELLAHVEALKSAPAQPVGPVLDALGEGRDVAFTRVRAVCPGLATAPFVQLYGIQSGQAGSRLISACQVESAPYRHILVDRGFVPDTVSARPPVDPSNQAPVEVVGVLRAPDAASFVTPANHPEQNRWFSRDAVAMGEALGASQAAPVFLMAETRTNPEWAALVPAPLPAEIPNRHLEYALTWFGLAAALAGVYAAMLLRRRKI